MLIPYALDSGWCHTVTIVFDQHSMASASICRQLTRTVRACACLHTGENQVAQTTRDPVAPAERSAAAKVKIARQHHEDGAPAHGFLRCSRRACDDCALSLLCVECPRYPDLYGDDAIKPSPAIHVGSIDTFAVQAGRGTPILSQYLENTRENTCCPWQLQIRTAGVGRH